MSWPARKWARRQPVPPKTSALLRALADHANANNESWPSLPTLRAETSFCRTVLIREGQFLKRLGLVSRKHRGPNSLLYTLHLDRNVTPEEVQKWTSTSARRSPRGRLQEVHRVDPIPIEPQGRAALPARAPSHEQGQRVAPPPDQKSEIPVDAARERRPLEATATRALNGSREGMKPASRPPAPPPPPWMRAAIMVWALTGEWDESRGPAPRQPGSEVPAALVDEIAGA